jgi:hypothetical protein
LFGLIVGRNFMHDVYGRKEMLSRIVWNFTADSKKKFYWNFQNDLKF